MSSLQQTGDRRYIRALAHSEGHHWQGIRAANDGAESIDLAADHDARCDAEHQRADRLVSLALEQTDIREMRNLIRASLAHRAEAYRYDDLEDERVYVDARGELQTAHGANQRGSELCEQALKTWTRGPEASDDSV